MVMLQQFLYNPYFLILIILLALVAEWFHLKRINRVKELAFAPIGKPRGWTIAAPFLRAIGIVCILWSLGVLLVEEPKVHKPKAIAKKDIRRIVIALDVSPSMQIKDAGPKKDMTRMQRASELMESVMGRIVLEQVRMSVVAIYNGAKKVVIDTKDIQVVRNILNDLPMDQAFDYGKTQLLEGIKEVADLTKDWPENSTTVILISDGDTVPETGMPELPKSIARVLVIGVGDPRSGTFIDGHQSLQDSSTLNQIARRLGGVYHEGNELHLPSDALQALAEIVPLDKQKDFGLREWALILLIIGSLILSFLPISLNLLGAHWKPA